MIAPVMCPSLAASGMNSPSGPDRRDVRSWARIARDKAAADRRALTNYEFAPHTRAVMRSFIQAAVRAMPPKV